MNKPNNIQEVEQPTYTVENSSTAAKVAEDKQQAPLIRYFSIFDESTESYMLGYN